jgi:excisionase family DNA binding protein
MQQMPALPTLNPTALPVLKVCEVAAALRVDPATVYRAVAAGDIRAVRIGPKKASTIRIPATELERLLAGEGGRD